MMPSCDVVVTAYNCAPFLKETLESIFAQTHQPEQIIVVDDGSLDDSLAMAKRALMDSCPDSIEWTVISTRNKGTASARNTGLVQTFADCVAFFDGDDIYLPDKIKRSLEMLEGRESAICSSGLIYRHETGRENPVMATPVDISTLAVNCNALTNPVMTRSVFEFLFGYNESFKACEDYDLYVRACQMGIPFVVVPEPQFIYRKHDGAKSRSMVETFQRETAEIKARAKALWERSK